MAAAGELAESWVGIVVEAGGTLWLENGEMFSTVSSMRRAVQLSLLFAFSWLFLPGTTQYT